MLKWRSIVLLLAIVAAAVLLGRPALRGIVALISKRPSNLGVREGKLAPCPASPNCVSTQSEDETHGIAPLPYTTSTAEAKERLLRVIRSMERSTIITDEPDYIYAEFRTPGLRYIDDVEFYFDEAAGVIHFRSAARLPYYDFKVNRKRMESIRRAFEAH
jgi:uncharacterized protein (DUF1499 family)